MIKKQFTTSPLPFQGQKRNFVVELCDWFAEHFGMNTPFSNATVKTYQVKGKVLNYTDMMLYKPYNNCRSNE